MPAPGDLIHQQSITTGTGSLTLTTVNGKRAFNDEFGTGSTDKFDYFIMNNGAAEWERGTGHLSSSTVLVRDTVKASSNANAAVNFSAGTKDIVNDIPAAQQFIVRVDAYGAKGDGSTDATAAFQKTLDTISAAGGGSLLIPDGSFVISSALTYSGQNLRVYGLGPNSKIIKTSTNADLFTISGQQYYTFENFVVVGGLSDTSGAMFHFSNTNNAAGLISVSRITTSGGYDVFRFDGGQISYISDSTILFNTRYGIYYGPLYVGAGYISNLSMSAIPNGSTGANTGAAIFVENGDTFAWQNCNIQNYQYNIKVVPPASTGRIANIFATNVFCDQVTRTAGNANWYFDGSASSAILERINLTNCWGGAGSDVGFIFKSTTEFRLTNCRAISNTKQGIDIQSGCSNFGIYLSTVEGNSRLSSGTYSGLLIEDTVSAFELIGNRCGPGSATDVVDYQKYGIEIAGTTHDNYQVVNNDCRGNITAGMLDAGTSGSSKILYANFNGVNQMTPSPSGLAVAGTIATALGASKGLTVNGPNGGSGEISISVSGGGSCGISSDGLNYAQFTTNTNVPFYIITNNVQRFAIAGNAYTANIPNSGGKYQINSVNVVGARDTGWTAWTGTGNKGTKAVGSATTADCAAAIKSILDALIAHGLIGT